MNSLIQELTQDQLRTDIPEFRAGDTVRIYHSPYSTVDSKEI